MTEADGKEFQSRKLLEEKEQYRQSSEVKPGHLSLLSAVAAVLCL